MHTHMDIVNMTNRRLRVGATASRRLLYSLSSLTRLINRESYACRVPPELCPFFVFAILAISAPRGADDVRNLRNSHPLSADTHTIYFSPVLYNSVPTDIDDLYSVFNRNKPPATTDLIKDTASFSVHRRLGFESRA